MPSVPSFSSSSSRLKKKSGCGKEEGKGGERGREGEPIKALRGRRSEATPHYAIGCPEERERERKRGLEAEGERGMAGGGRRAERPRLWKRERGKGKGRWGIRSEKKGGEGGKRRGAEK